MTPTLAIPNDGTDATQEHPEQLPGEEPSPSYGPRNEKLPKQLVNLLKAAIRDVQQQELYVRRREVMRDRLNRFYERGYQHLYADYRTGGFTQAVAGAPVGFGQSQSQTPNYIDDYNIFQPYLRIIEAILTQNSPGIDFQPINPKLSEDIEAAQTAESYRKMFDRSSNVKSIQTQIVRMMGLSGRTVVWTRTEANAQRFGYNEDGTPKQMETASVYGTLESRVPLMAKTQGDCLYAFLYDDPDVKQSKTEYPDFAEEINPGVPAIGESAYERTARLGILQGTRSQAETGSGFTHLSTRMHGWMRPAMFTGKSFDEPFDGVDESDMDEQGIPLSCKEKLNQLFPLGVHAVFVGEVYVGSWAESMDDALCIGFPYEGDGMFRLALMDPMVVVQDRFNDNMNAAAEVWDMGWPSTWTNADTDEYEAIAMQKSDPYAIRQKKCRADQALENEFFREPNPELPETFLKFTESLQGELPQFMLATPPAIFGAAMDDQRTASGYAQARAQAMGQLGLIWAQVQALFATMYYQAALFATKNPNHSEEITIPSGGDGSSQTIILSRLSKGRFGAFPDKDSGFPESTTQKRASFNAILQQAALAPAIAMQINQSPQNWKLFSALNGFPELDIPEADSWEKQEFEIEILLQQEPIGWDAATGGPNPQAVENAQVQHAAIAIKAASVGLPEPPPVNPESLLKSSVTAKRYDFHAWEFAMCKSWLSSADCRRQQADGNLAGIKNVELHAAEHEEWMQMLAPQAPGAPLPLPSRPAPPPPPPPVNPAPVSVPASM